MQDREKFLEILDELVVIAETKDKTITMDEIKEAFKNSEFDEDQFEPIYAYLAENKISIKNYTPAQDNNVESLETQEEAAYVQMYLDDLDAIDECDESELQELYQRIRSKDELAKTRMIEGSLKLVVSIAKEYRGKGVIVGDLIQEGNIGLINAVTTLSSLINGVNVKEYLDKEIRSFIDLAIVDQYSESKIGQEAIIKVNRMSKAAKELEEELGRYPEVTEVADYMGISNDEVKDIIRISNEALNVDHHHH